MNYDLFHGCSQLYGKQFEVKGFFKIKSPDIFYVATDLKTWTVAVYNNSKWRTGISSKRSGAISGRPMPQRTDFILSLSRDISERSWAFCVRCRPSKWPFVFVRSITVNWQETATASSICLTTPPPVWPVTTLCFQTERHTFCHWIR